MNPTWPSNLFVSNNLQKTSLNYLGEAENFYSVATCDLKKLNPCWIPWLSFPNFPASCFFSGGNLLENRDGLGNRYVCVKFAEEDLLQPLLIFWPRCPRLQRLTTLCHHCLYMTSLPPVPIPAQIKEDPSFSPDLRRQMVRNLQTLWVKASFRSLSERGAKKKKRAFLQQKFSNSQGLLCNRMLLIPSENSFGSESSGFSQPPRIPLESSYGKLRPVSDQQILWFLLMFKG